MRRIIGKAERWDQIVAEFLPLLTRECRLR
jgi:hypothetical protein